MSSTRENTFINTNNRIFYLSDNIDKESIGILAFYILCVIKEDDDNDKKEKNFKREPIKLYINSYGGSVDDMWGLIDIILNSETPVYTYCTGYAMSAAFNIFLAGHKRFCYKHSTFMYHQMSCWRDGKYQDLVEDRVEMDRLNKSMEKYVLERTKLTQDVIDSIREKKKDFYVHADDAVKYGIVNEIL
jgi:ATP-dependent Clp protease protease subunit